MPEGPNTGAVPASGVRDLFDRKSISDNGQPMRGKLIFLALLALLALISSFDQTTFEASYPLHMALEFAAVVLVVLAFAVVWQTPASMVSRSYLFIAIGLLASGWFSFAHAVLTSGVPEAALTLTLAQGDAMLLAGRLILAVSLLGVSFFPAMRPATQAQRYGIFASYTLVCVLASVAIFLYGNPLGSGWAWSIPGLLVLASWRSYQNTRRSADKFTSTLFIAMATVTLAELLLSPPDSGTRARDLLGHAYRLLAYGIFYQAMFSACVTRAYDNLSAQVLTRRKTDQTLRTQAMALNATVTPIFVADPLGALVWRNRASKAHEAPNANDKETRNSLFEAPITPDVAQSQEMRRLLEAGSIWHGRIRMKNPQGKEIVLDRTVTPVRDELGALHGYIAVSEDVTEREFAEIRYKRVLDMSIDGFWIADANGQLREVNEAFVRLTGYTATELRTMHINQLEDGRHADVVQQRLARTVRLGKERFEGRLRHKTGQEFFVDVTVMYDPEYQLFFGFVHDRTEMVQAAATRRALERQLQQSQKVEQLGQLTGGIAHDFNNSLATILGYSRLALERFVPDRQSKLANYLGEVVAASERARDLIAKMLSFASNRPSLGAEVIAASVVVQQVAEMMRVSIPAGIELKTWIEDDVVIRVDPGELSQVLVNLVINARDAIGEHGTIDIRVRRVGVQGQVCAASHSSVSGTFAAVEVSDSGAGIAKAHMSRLFDPFFTTKEVGKGTGLGLSMVQGILRRSNAYVMVTSEPGHGSSFKLLFPLVSASVAVRTDQEAKPSAPLVSGKRVWVVDDEPSVARYLGELLKDWGYQTRLFNHPSQMLTAFEIEHNDVDLIISDQSMPGMTGLALSQRLLAIKPALPVILCSGYTDACSRSEVQRHGVRRYLMKPINPKELREALTENLHTQTRDATKQQHSPIA